MKALGLDCNDKKLDKKDYVEDLLSGTTYAGGRAGTGSGMGTARTSSMIGSETIMGSTIGEEQLE